MRRLVLIPVLFLVAALPATAQYGDYRSPNDFEFACPMRAVTAVLKTISPEGHLTFESKGQLMVAKTTEETLFRIPGYSKDELKAGALVKLKAGSKAKMRFCSSLAGPSPQYHVRDRSEHMP